MSKYGLKLIVWVFPILCISAPVCGQSLHTAPWQSSFSPAPTLELNPSLLQTALDQSLSRWDSRNSNKGVPVNLPHPDGQQELYQLWRSEQMEAGLSEKFPAIQTYFGQAQSDPRRTIYLTVSRKGIKVLYFDHTGLNYSLEPLHPQLPTYQFVQPGLPAEAANLIAACTAEMDTEDNRLADTDVGTARRGEVKLYRYRLALACTGEYGSYHGNSKEEVLGAMNELLAQVNAIFEREASIHFDLVANNDVIIFLDPSTDPYDNNSVEDLLETNKTICNYSIGYPNFDLGHVLATKFGGQAQIGSVCNVSRKAKAFSGLEQPEGYYMGAIFAHELAHQLGAQHTQSNDCNRNFPTALEPGSGSTLMAYAGICAPNVQSLPDDYFHGNSLELIKRKASQGIVFGCAPGTQTDNFPPAADAGPDLYIPIGTPFRLKGSGTDPDGDSLSYTWEQMDALLPEDTLGWYGPAFRSLPPSTSPERAIGGRQDAWEMLPEKVRQATFRLTVRDHHMGLGGSDYDEMTVFFIDSVGPLAVTHPNAAGTSWEIATNQTVEWEVAGTDREPVNCDTVSISLSADGGLTYPFLLASGVPNNGSAPVNLPEALSGHDFRIKVSCDQAPIFDVSDKTFSIIDPNATEPVDTMSADTTMVPPTDTGTTVIDTMTTVVGDTIVTPNPDTIDHPVVDTIDVPIDTVPDLPMDTIPDVPNDTIPDMPGDTIPDVPNDTIPDMPNDTIPDVPQDTIPDMPSDTVIAPPGDTLTNPIDTIPDVPQDTLGNPPMDTVPDMPADTIDHPPSDTVTTPPPDTTIAVNNPPVQQDPDIGLILQEVQIAPNPTNGTLYWKARIRESNLADFDLVNSQGQIVEERRVPLDAGTNVIRWDLSAYPSGFYWMRMKVKGRYWTRPFILKR